MKETNRRPIDQGWRGNRRLTIRKFNRWYTSDELIASGSLPGHVRDKVIGFIRRRSTGLSAVQRQWLYRRHRQNTPSSV
jgi:hypothetical protein